jgi:hypothetical protein|tara:strand:+ start:334 stop:603 length:270 start_codon:yes stop_codon:yes gene_type:complete
MKNENIIEYLLENHEDEDTLLIFGFQDAYVGVTAAKPYRIVYDYWKCLNCLIADDEFSEALEFDEALDYLDEFIERDLGENAPLFIKYL